MLIELGVLLSRVLVGGIFLIAGFAKLKASSGVFLNSIMGYDLLSKPVAIIFARWLPWLEVMAGGLLIIGLWGRFAVILSITLLLLFSGAIAISLLRGKDQACGCFQTLTPVQWRLVYRNLGLIGLLLPVYALNAGAWAIGNWLAPQMYSHFQISLGLIVAVASWLVLLNTTFVLQHIAGRKSPSEKVPN